MHILICSDGTDAADKPARLGALIAGPAKAKVTLLGISEESPPDRRLHAALESEAIELRKFGLRPEIVERAGEPIEEIVEETKKTSYDLVIIGARPRRKRGPYWRSLRTYKVIKSIAPPVLVAAGSCEHLARFLVCTGGKRYSDDVVKFTAQIAAAVGAAVTLLHVMPEPPAMYGALASGDDELTGLLEGGSELGRNLVAQKASLEALGVPAEVRVRRGIVLEQVFAEVRAGKHDLIVTGSSRSSGVLQQYIMGDITRSIVNRASCPVLVARSGSGGLIGVWAALKRAFAPSNPGKMA